MRFGGIRAIDDCSLNFAAGRITGLIGPNGAGKSTLFDVVAGGLVPTAGTVRLEGEDVTRLPAFARYRRGLHRTFQIAREFARLTVRENLMVAARGQSGEALAAALFKPGHVREEERAHRERACEVMDFLALTPLADAPAGTLSGGQKKLLELGRALMSPARIILLDEIGAGVNPTLLAQIAGHIRMLNEEGMTFAVIEHDMDFIAGLCDPVIVMAEGRVLVQGPMAEVRADRAVVEAYFGSAA
ncbi:MAG: ABC transporter ATP-binding protein [Geminicoccaceae bacterium]|nr:ABC transporter ATP-binding protein [Geminicoccaceae bacterium]